MIQVSSMDSANHLKKSNGIKIIKITTKFKCSKCDLEYSKEIEIWDKYVEFFKEHEPMPIQCEECAEKERLQDIIECSDKLIKTLPKKYQKLKDYYNFQERVDKMKYKSIFLHGETGSGKTFFAIMVLKELWLEGKTGMFLSYPEFMNFCLNNFERARSKLNEVKDYAGCLIIDDLGAERMTDYSKNFIYIIINYRESNSLQTIITSNYSIKQLDYMIDKRISSRIAGMCDIFELNGDKRIPF